MWQSHVTMRHITDCQTWLPASSQVDRPPPSPDPAVKR